MCVPYRSAAPGTPKDAFNFFQSQVRINIECAFGILVHRFGILRKPMLMNVEIRKITLLVLVLCKLHNLCIAQDGCQLSAAHGDDVSNILKEGGIYRPRIDESGDAVWTYDFDAGSNDRVIGLLDGGQHQEDHSRRARRRYRRATDLPHVGILRAVANGGHRCPPRSQRHQL